MPDYWQEHDRTFHALSRQGFASGPYGGVFPFADPPPPALRPKWRGTVAELPEPEPLDYELGELLVERRSVRDPKGITPRQLATVLDLFRIRERLPGPRYEALRKAIPGGGGMHGLEAYVALRACEGLHAGIYWYDPEHGHLVRVSGLTTECIALLDDAGRSAGVEHQPAALVILAARFARWQHKYRRMAYAAILKDAGVAYCAMQLVTTALGLHACPLGGGDSELFSRATGMDPWVEGSVAELAIW